MNTKKIISIISFFVLALFLSGCGPNSKFAKRYDKPFKHNTPLIKDDIKKKGKSEIAKTLELGPKPVDGDTRKLGKRKKITSETNKNYLIIPEEFPLLKQRVTLKYKNLDFSKGTSFWFLSHSLSNLDIYTRCDFFLSNSLS